MKEEIREIFLNLGADLCGIANIYKFSNAPKGFHPADIFPDTKTVIVFGKAMPKGLAKIKPGVICNHFSEILPLELDGIARKAAVEIENRYDCTVVPLPSDSPYEYWNKEKMEGRGLISMRHAAVSAGLGTLGKNTLLINKDFGNMLIISAVLTDLDLPSDPPAEKLCVESCRLCLDNCPVGALDGKSTAQSLCRPNTYTTNERGFSTTNCNKCRTVCPRAFGTR